MKYLPGEAGLREGSPALSPQAQPAVSRASLARTRSPSSILLPQCLGVQDRKQDTRKEWRWERAWNRGHFRNWGRDD